MQTSIMICLQKRFVGHCGTCWGYPGNQRKRVRIFQLQLNKFFERIMHNWPIKILSIAAAVLLFLFNQMATLEERFLSIPLEIRTAEQFIPAENYPRTVRVTLRGQSEDINLVLEDDINVYADFSEYEEEGRYTVPIRVFKGGSLSHIEPLELQVVRRPP